MRIEGEKGKELNSNVISVAGTESGKAFSPSMFLQLNNRRQYGKRLGRKTRESLMNPNVDKLLADLSPEKQNNQELNDGFLNRLEAVMPKSLC